MLILTRRVGESLRIGDDVSVTVLGIKGSQVRIGVNAPKTISVHREEVYDRIHDKNSKFPTSFSVAKSDNFLSRQALPATITPLGNIEILEKFFPNLITTPSNVLSLMSVFDPAPKIWIFSLFLNLFKNNIKSGKLSGLK